MRLDENNCESRLKALSLQDWQPLLELIPEIEQASGFGEWIYGEKGADGTVPFPWFKHASIVQKFLDAVYSIPIVISFNWGAWDEGKKIASDVNFNFDTVDIVVKCKLITAIVRNDRFCEGVLDSAFESGLILKVLKSIEKEVHEKNRT